MPKAGNKHPREDCIGAGKSGIGFLKIFCPYAQVLQWREHSGKDSRNLWVPNRFRARNLIAL